MMTWLERARVEKLMTQQDVARATGMSQPAYSNIEKGKVKPRISTIKKISAALDIDPSSFYEDKLIRKDENVWTLRGYDAEGREVVDRIEEESR